MIGASVYDINKIDTTSSEFKEMVSESIKQYIIKNWDICVCIEEKVELGRNVASYFVEL